MEYRILGPLEVLDEGRALSLGGLKERAVLAVLLLHHGEVVSLDRLIDSLWGEDPPAGAINTVQTYVSRLRKVLHANRDSVLITRQPGYVLQLTADELDVDRFKRLVEEGRAALANGAFETASGKLGDALGLWRGPALADFTYEPFAEAEIERLEEAQIAAREDRLEADLALGRHNEVVGELKTLAASHPLRERLQAQLMHALYRCGRQAEALDAYREARRLLVEELGMEPGRDLQRVHDLVLRHDPSLEPEVAFDEVLPHNLPSEATSFIGREWEVGELTKLLRETRLLTVTGVGGSGKTRLTIQVGREVHNDYADGVWLVELGALVDEDMVDQTVAAVLGVRPQTGMTLSEVLATALQRRHMIFILDNCEHLIDGCAQLIANLLSSCPNLRVLATSREALGVSGEVVWQLPPLTFPDDDSLPSEELEHYESVRLFMERAAAASPDLTMTPEDSLAVGRVCRRLDGIPLAIELAATWARLLTPQEIDEHLDDRFRLLSRGNRTAPLRQQTLRATADWSYELLALQEQLLFARLSVFAGGFTLDAATAVCSGQGIDREEVLELLARLVDKSLVVTDKPSRYRLLETLREYGAEKLPATGEAASVHRSHAEYFRALAERAEVGLHGPDQVQWLRRLRDDQDNLRAALAWSLESEEAETAQRLAAALLNDWDMRGTVMEGLSWVEKALAKGTGTPDRVRAKALATAAVLAEAVGALDRATAYAQEALSIYRELGDRFGEAWSNHLLGSVAHYKGDYDQAVELLESSLAVYRDLGDEWHTGRALHRLGMVARLQGDYDRASKLQKEALDIFQQKGDGSRSAYSLWMLGVVERYRGEYEKAFEYCEAGLRLFHELGDKMGIAHVHTTLGDIARLQEDFDRAVSLYEKGLTELERQGDQRCVASTFSNLGDIAHRRSDHSRSKELYGESLEIRVGVGDKAGIAECLEGLGLVEWAEGRSARAARLFGAAEALREATGATLPLAERSTREEELKALRASLGEEEFRTAWDQGRAMAQDEAVAFAVDARLSEV